MMADESNETPAPLSDADIAELRESLDGRVRYWGVTWIGGLLATLAARDARLAALERENAALREIVAAVAEAEREDDIPGDPSATRIAVALVDRARALLATQTPATGATAVGEVYTDRADHEHDWRQIESRTDADTGRVWHRVQCRICRLISELSTDPQQPAD